MLKMDDIRELIKIVDHSSVTHVDYEAEGFKLTIKKETKAADASFEQHTEDMNNSTYGTSISIPPKGEQKQSTDVQQDGEADTDGLHKIVSPMVGTFYHAPSPEAEAYVKVGDKVNENSVVCIVEAMKLMNEIEAELRGEIVEVLVENGQLVEYGQALFLVKPE